MLLVYTRGVDVTPARIDGLWRHIQAQVPTASLRFIGDWPDAPILPHSERLGWLQGDALTAALRSSAVALFPAPDQPLVRAKSPARLLDCMAHGLPVVVEDVGEYGVLASPAGRVAGRGDDKGLVEAVVELLQQPDLRAHVGRQVWEQAGRHTWSQRVEVLDAWLRAGRQVESQEISRQVNK